MDGPHQWRGAVLVLRITVAAPAQELVNHHGMAMPGSPRERRIALAISPVDPGPCFEKRFCAREVPVARAVVKRCPPLIVGGIDLGAARQEQAKCADGAFPPGGEERRFPAMRSAVDRCASLQQHAGNALSVIRRGQMERGVPVAVRLIDACTSLEQLHD